MTFMVKVQPAGLDFQVARDEPILPAAIRQGIGLPYGCKDGACGSCKCMMVEGRVIHGAHQAKALSEAEEAAGYILTCCATPQTDLVLESRQVVGADQFPVVKMPVRVAAMSRPAPDVAVVTLQLPANNTFRWHAGQYIEVLLRDGARRAYSMANAPHTAADGLQLHIRHMPGGKFTDHVFGAMKEKEILRVEGPFGTFYLREEGDRPLVMLASGTGFAPIKSILEDMAQRGIERRAVLYWGCRVRDDLYLHDWAMDFAARHAWLRYVPVLSEPRTSDAWTGRTGFVHRAVIEDLPDLSGHDVYACGATVMVDAAQRDFTATCRLDPDRFFADAFVTEADRAAG